VHNPGDGLISDYRRRRQLGTNPRVIRYLREPPKKAAVPMNRAPSRNDHAYTLVAIAAGLLLAVCPLTEAHADDPLGLYVGGAIGQSRVEATGLSYDVPTLGQFGNP
jgi:hypothetical protein